MLPVSRHQLLRYNRPQTNPVRTFIHQYIVRTDEGPLDALQRLDANRHKFLLVTDPHGVLAGTLTESDIRKALLSRQSLAFQLGEIARRPLLTISLADPLDRVVGLFQATESDFLPIVTRDNEVVNFLTRDQLFHMLLQDSPYTPRTDFSPLDRNQKNHPLCQRPWGFYKSLFFSDFAQTKIITLFPQQQLSLQKHFRREEYWTVIKGEGLMTLGDRQYPVSRGDRIMIPTGEIHRIKNTADSGALVFVEVQLGDYFGEDDIVRLEDAYGRA